MQVYIVLGGCAGNEHIIAVCDNEKSAEGRAKQENENCKGLGSYAEPWEILN